MLVVVELHVIPEPLYGRRRVGLDLALQVHVELEGLAQALAGDLDGRLELHLHVHVATGTL